MPDHLRIEMLPAGYGDALWIEYGNEHATHRILIDGGLASTHETLHSRLLALPEADRTMELVVCTHMDMDHINGIIRLFKDAPPHVKIGDVWFNGWDQIQGFLGNLGPSEAEQFDAYVRQHGLNKNHAFDGLAVMIPDSGPLPSVRLPGGMKITLLGPTRHRLTRLAAEWKKHVEGLKLVPGEAVDTAPIDGSPIGILGLLGTPDVTALAAIRSDQDNSTANGSSIVLLLEYGGKTALFTGDAFPSDILAALSRRNSSGLPFFPIDAFKISHHGGKGNTSHDLLRYISSEHYLISTSGVRHEHPDVETIASILVHSARLDNRQPLHLHFNYRSTHNQDWDNADLKRTHHYEAHYPAPGMQGLVLDLIPPAG